MPYDITDPAAAHRLQLEGREKLTVAGVEDVERFDDQCIVLRTGAGVLVVSGESLHIGKLSLDGGELHVDGRIDALTYEDAPEVRGGGLFSRLFGYEAANSWGNVLDNILCILFAYATNRAFVFNSKTRGRAMAKEFGAFVTCRLGTMLLDTAIMLVLGNLLAAQGAALMDELMQGVLSVVAHWLGPDTAIQMAASYAGTPAGVTDGSAAIAVIGGADGPTAIFVTSRYNAQALWGLAVKVFSNVLVIVLNYVFSKLIIFKNRK